MSTPILKKLRADPEDRIDLTVYGPELDEDAQAVWDHLCTNTPYWWAHADLDAVVRFCRGVGMENWFHRQISKSKKEGKVDEVLGLVKSLKSHALEVTKYAYALGLTPQSRAALKLEHVAQPNDREAESDDSNQAIDVDSL